MTYRFLAAIGESYRNETTVPVGERESFLTGCADFMQGAMRALDNFKKYGGGPKVAEDVPAGAGRVRALREFHEQQIENVTFIDKTIEEFKGQRLMLIRSGAALTKDGKIIWPKVPVKVQYDRDLAQQDLTRVDFKGGKLYTTKGKPFDTRHLATAHSGPGFAIYVMSIEGNFHVSSHAVGLRHHSSLLGGQVTAGAGELKVDRGTITWLSNKSGHYCPDMLQLLQVLDALQRAQVPLNFRVAVVPANREFPSVGAFLKAHGWTDDLMDLALLKTAYGDAFVDDFAKQRGWVLMAEDVAFKGARAGFYDTSAKPPRRVDADEIEKEMVAVKNIKKAQFFDPGVGR